LSTVVARRRLAEVGRNELPSHDQRSGWQLAISLLREPMLILLLAATGLYIVFGDLCCASFRHFAAPARSWQ
jgi:Ca2+-transporting ATPase